MLFDPLSFVSPFIIRLKMLFQNLCSSKVDWDGQLEGETIRQWNSLPSDIKSLIYHISGYKGVSLISKSYPTGCIGFWCLRKGICCSGVYTYRIWAYSTRYLTSGIKSQDDSCQKTVYPTVRGTWSQGRRRRCDKWG